MIERPAKRFYEFDEFRIDLEERRLLRNERPVHLGPKVFDILLALVENRGHTVEKGQLFQRVWADAFVEEGSLNRNISTLRRALNEDANDPRWIKTVPKRGYRFDGNVREVIEEDEQVIVERRTRYKVSVRESTEIRTGFSRWALIASAIGGMVLIFGAAWSILGPPTSDANAAASTAPNKARKTEAQELYTKARALWQNRSVEGLYQATVDLERAVILDPDNALAHAALADCYAFDVMNWKRAESTAHRAIQLAPELGQPYATIGFIRTFWERKLNEAEPYFRQAILLQPDYSTAHQWYAINLTARSQGGSGLAEIMRAAELEPNSAAINADHCHILYLSRKFDLAVEQCRKTLQIDPDLLAANRHLYEIYSEKEMYPEAIEAFFRAEKLNMTTQISPGPLERLRKVYEIHGIRGFWRERIAMLKASDTPAAYAIGQYYARLGRSDEALDWYELSSKGQEFDHIFFAVDPVNSELLVKQRARELARSPADR